MQSKYIIHNICKSVNGREILKNIDLEFGVGLNVIVGQSGAGKSTLLNLLGLIDECSGGSISFGDFEITQMTENEIDRFRAENIGFVFQNCNLISDMTVNENLQIAMEINNISSSGYEEILEKFNVSGLLEKKVNVLSGGEQQRIAIVRALLKNSRIILADEPTGNLDSMNSRIVFQTLKECAEKFNKIVIVVTHDEKMAKEYANNIIELSDGMVVDNYEVEGVKESKAVEVKKACGMAKSKLPFRRKIKFVANFFRRKTGRVAMLAIISAFTIALSALVFDINNQATVMFENMNTNYLETDLVQIYTKTTNISNDSEYGGTFNDSELKQIKESGLFIEITEFIQMGLIVKSDASEIDIVNSRYIEISDFYKERIMSNDIEGRFIENNNEVILGKDICQYLFNDDSPVGKVVTLTNGRAEVQATVAGVNNTKNVEGCYLSYIPNTITFEIAGKSIDEFAYIDVKADVEKSSNVYNGGYVGNYGDNSEYPLVEGRYPENESEIAIDIEIFNEYKKKHSEGNIFTDEMYLNIGNVFEVVVSGIYDSDSSQMFYINKNILENMKSPAPTSMYCYAINDKVINDFKDTEINSKFDCGLMYEHLRGQISDRTESVRQILLFLSCLLFVISVVVINSFVNMSIKERTYEIGVLRALGGTKKAIRGIFWLESFIIGVLSSAISIIIFSSGKYLVANTLMENSTFVDLPVIIICVIISSVLFIMVSSILPLQTINRMKPIECIRAR